MISAAATATGMRVRAKKPSFILIWRNFLPSFFLFFFASSAEAGGLFGRGIVLDRGCARSESER